MNIRNVDSKDVLAADALPEYERGISFFFSELVELNINIYIIKQILEFPLDLFRHRSQTVFFRMAVHNFFNASLLIITKLATDQKGDLYTLLRFRNRIKEIAKPEYRKLLREYFKQTQFDQQTNLMLKRAKSLRDNRVAHTSKELLEGAMNDIDLDFSELESLCDTLNSLLNTLSFNVGNRFLPAHYLPNVQYPPGREQKPDIEELIDCVAKNSDLLNMPDRNPGWWDIQQQTLAKGELKQLNKYRRKFGLTEV
jgi:hypothetical protein